MSLSAGPASRAARFPQQLLDAHAELRFRRPLPRDFKTVLEIGGRSERPGEGAPAFREVGQVVEEPLRQNRVETVGMGAEIARDARRAADDLGDEAEQFRSRGEQRKQLHAGRKPTQEGVETRERLVGVRGVGERLQQARHQFRQQFAGASAAGGRHAAVVPAADRLRNRLALGEPHAAQRLQRFRVRVGAREHQIAAARKARAKRGGVLEQFPAMRRHAVQMPAQLRDERLRARMAEKRRNARQFTLAFGKAVGLPVVDHLQAVLDAAQIPVGLDQFPRLADADMARRGERLQRRFGASRAQRRVAPAPYELLGLGEELDLADAAAAEFDVVARAPGLASAPDLALDGLDIADRGEIEVFAPHERPYRAQERLARRQVPRDGPRLDHGGALPILPQTRVIAFRRRRRNGERRRRRIGAQPEIGAEHVTVGGALLKQPPQAPGEPDEDLLRRSAPRQPRRVGVVEDDQVDIARIVELPAAQFSHCEHDEARARPRRAGVADFELSRAPGLAQQMIDRMRDRRIGEAAERGGGASFVPPSRKVSRGDDQRRALPGAPQCARDIRIAARRRSDIAVESVQQARQGDAGPVAQRRPQRFRPSQRATTEKRGVAEKHGEQIALALRPRRAGCGAPVRQTARRGFGVGRLGENRKVG